MKSVGDFPERCRRQGSAGREAGLPRRQRPPVLVSWDGSAPADKRPAHLTPFLPSIHASHPPRASPCPPPALSPLPTQGAALAPEPLQPKAYLQQLCQKHGWPAPKFSKCAPRAGGRSAGYRYAVLVERPNPGGGKRGGRRPLAPVSCEGPTPPGEGEDPWVRPPHASYASYPRVHPPPASHGVARRRGRPRGPPVRAL